MEKKIEEAEIEREYASFKESLLNMAKHSPEEALYLAYKCGYLDGVNRARLNRKGKRS